ncbi:MAG: primosomal protein N', partial [Desulfosarcinaceae bacterium]
TRPGEVVLQTYNPEHFSVTAARNQDFEMFYRQEIALRKALHYPPYSRMIQIRINGRDKGKTADHARWLGEQFQRLRRGQEDFSAVQMLGPIEAPLTRIDNQYRWQLLLKSSQAGALHRLVHAMLFGGHSGPARSAVQVSLDVDPVFLM